MKFYTSPRSKYIGLGLVLVSICIVIAFVYRATNSANTPDAAVPVTTRIEKTEQEIVQEYVNSRQRNFPPDLSLKPVFAKGDFYGWKAENFTSTSGKESQYEGLQRVQEFSVKREGGTEALDVEEFHIADIGVFATYIRLYGAMINPGNREAYLVTIPNTVPNAGVFIFGKETALLVQPQKVSGYGWPMDIDQSIPELLQQIVLP